MLPTFEKIRMARLFRGRDFSPDEKVRLNGVLTPEASGAEASDQMQLIWPS